MDHTTVGKKTYDTIGSIEAVRKLPRGLHRDIRKATALARRFCDEVVRPHCKNVDLQVTGDNDYIPEDFIREACRWGLYTLWIPKLFGGKGMHFLSLYLFIEEISSVCAGLANVLSVHYLGLCVLFASCNLKIINRILREVVREEKKGKACLISLSWTEPDAGTDQQEEELIHKAKVQTLAVKTQGGYIVNGRKIFISGGHFSTWHITVCYEDLRHPGENIIMLAVKNGMKGFSFGHREKKMGQKACVASELIYDDCFVPDDCVCLSQERLAPFGMDLKELNMRIINLFTPISRTGVASIATGIARGAYELAMDYAVNKTIDGERFINLQWVQTHLAEMYKNYAMSQATVLESAYTNTQKSRMISMLFRRDAFFIINLLPRMFFTIFVAPFMKLKIVNRLYLKMTIGGDYSGNRLASGIGSLIKFGCSDISVTNSCLAMELMGADGTRHDMGAEKFLRDAKLLQIYEGTNEVNRVNLFHTIAPHTPEIKIFQ
ncbi:MAG: acyl-CoA dehydrogenase family protein [Spirochaetes bacterium]|nr:acyl-CoA dehydrogenase family protein [Spirochaetota bacterium]